MDVPDERILWPASVLAGVAMCAAVSHLHYCHLLISVSGWPSSEQFRLMTSFCS